jgi:hypothetical protein
MDLGQHEGSNVGDCMNATSAGCAHGLVSMSTAVIIDMQLYQTEAEEPKKAAPANSQGAMPTVARCQRVGTWQAPLARRG